MKRIKPSKPTGANGVSWPRHAVKSVEARSKDLIIRITDWTKDRDEPAYDVEVYIGGVYDWNESKIFPLSEYDKVFNYVHTPKEIARTKAISFANDQTARLL